jgi:2-C-methyl-D-erythritol 4-phosphate cytidylyltransferase
LPRPDGPVYSIVVAAGDGTRFGGRKQLAELGGRTIVSLAVEAVAGLSEGVVVVVPPDLAKRPRLLEELELSAFAAKVVTTPGGATRAASVRAGLACVPARCRFVLVHDAARPLASLELTGRVLRALGDGAVAVVPVLPVTDTIKRVEDGCVVATIDRSQIVAVQTPQGFVADLLRRAHDGEPEATDDAGLVESLGERVAVVSGEQSNLKVTSREDLALATHWLERRGSGVGSSP